MTCPSSEIELPTRPRWVLAIVDGSGNGDDILAAVCGKVPGIAVTVATGEWPSRYDPESGSARPEHDVVISMSDVASWRTIALLSSLRSRLKHEDITVLVVTDVTEELLPVHITDFPGLRRIGLDDDIAEAVSLLLTH